MAILSSSKKLVLLVIPPIILNNNQVMNEAIINVNRITSVPCIHRFCDMTLIRGSSDSFIFLFIEAVDKLSAMTCFDQSKFMNAVESSVVIKLKKIITFSCIWLM